MNSVFAKLWLFTLILAAALLAPQRADADDRFGHHRRVERIVVFGDSLSDPGNVFALNGGQTVAPPDYGMGGLDPQGIPKVIALIPEAPYTSRRFSNGVTWIELLAGVIGLGSNARPAVPGALFGVDDGRAANYAVGGATAANLGPEVSQFPLGTQVDLFLSDVRWRAPADALYVIAIGGNDIRAALALGPGVLNMALASVGENIAKLHAAGARKFLIWNVPNLARTPAIQRLDPFVCAAVAAPAGCLIGSAAQASAGYNAGLGAVLQEVGALPEIEIVQFDLFGSLEAIVANPGRFGLKDATTACIKPNVPPLFRCAQPDRHLFWDGIHPTRAGHAIIAFLVGKTLISAVLQD